MVSAQFVRCNVGGPALNKVLNKPLKKAALVVSALAGSNLWRIKLALTAEEMGNPLFVRSLSSDPKTRCKTRIAASL